MKKHLLVFCMVMFVLGAANMASAVPINAVSASGTGTYKNSPDLLIDGVIPSEGTWWTATTNVWWYGTDPVFTIDLGALYSVEDVVVSVDNNDDYNVSYSLNNINWFNLFTIDRTYGDIPVIPGGMDTMSTILGDPEYVSQIDFSPVQARYLKISATGGDNFYAVAEVKAYGTHVPEPSTILLIGVGLLGLAVYNKRFGKKG